MKHTTKKYNFKDVAGTKKHLDRNYFFLYPTHKSYFDGQIDRAVRFLGSSFKKLERLGVSSRILSEVYDFLPFEAPGVLINPHVEDQAWHLADSVENVRYYVESEGEECVFELYKLLNQTAKKLIPNQIVTKYTVGLKGFQNFLYHSCIGLPPFNHVKHHFIDPELWVMSDPGDEMVWKRGNDLVGKIGKENTLTLTRMASKILEEGRFNYIEEVPEFLRVCGGLTYHRDSGLDQLIDVLVEDAQQEDLLRLVRYSAILTYCIKKNGVCTIKEEGKYLNQNASRDRAEEIYARTIHGTKSLADEIKLALNEVRDLTFIDR
ncbi:MAG: hypothetical protein WCV90_02470 [Candidatus Woesearchaeota archaeon]|jgi:hypothetical protein